MARLQPRSHRDIDRLVAEDGWTVIQFPEARYDDTAYEGVGFLRAIVDWVVQDDIPGWWYPVRIDGGRATRIGLSSPAAAMAFKIKFC